MWERAETIISAITEQVTALGIGIKWFTMAPFV